MPNPIECFRNITKYKPYVFTNIQEVKDQLEILNNTKPSGPDGVAPRILRSVSQCLVQSI
jgi:hypothetical protein